MLAIVRLLLREMSMSMFPPSRERSVGTTARRSREPKRVFLAAEETARVVWYIMVVRVAADYGSIDMAVCLPLQGSK